MSIGIGDPLGHLRAAAVTESEHPVEHEEEPPPSYENRRLLVAALIIGLPIAAFLAWRMLV